MSKLTQTHNSKNDFFNTFLDEITNKDFKIDESLKDPEFRDYVINENGKTIETIQQLKESLSSLVKKPQQCLYTDNDYYLAKDIYTDTYYVCYKNLMIIDVDFHKLDYKDVSDEKKKEKYIQFLKDFAKKNPEFLFEIYSSKNGLHIFVLNKLCNYKNKNDIQLMLDLKSDFYYTIYCNIRGWCVRLNPKKNEYNNPKPIYELKERIGTGDAIKHLEKLTILHMKFLDLFKYAEVCKMK